MTIRTATVTTPASRGPLLGLAVQFVLLSALAGTAGLSTGGWLAGAAIIGALTARILPRYPLWQGIVINAFGGMVIIYAIGIPVLAHNAHISLRAATVANGWYLAGDSVKVVVTALVARQVHRAYPGLITARRAPAVRNVG